MSIRSWWPTTLRPARAEPAIDHAVADPQRALSDPNQSTGLDALAVARTQPSPAVVWRPQWDEGRQVEVTGPEHLGALIATLASFDDDAYGGIQLTGSAGPWSQVMDFDDGEFLVELHPRQHEPGSPGGLYFERMVPVTAADAGAIAWEWVRTGQILPGYEVEYRVVPEGRNTDVEM